MASEEKKLFVQELVQSIKAHPLIGIVNLHGLPAQQLQKMRALLLKNNIKLVMARKKLLELAIQGSSKENIEQLTEKIMGMPALLFSNSNPFALYKIIQKNKSPASAKVGQAAPRDLIVKAGATNFAPGPIISEFAAVGIKTKVEAGKLSVISDTVIAKEGAIISAKVAETLKRLDIKPMEIGLSLVAVWENGLVFNAQQLHLDEAEYLGLIMSAAQGAINLAVEAAYTSPEIMELLLQKSFREAEALSLELHLIDDSMAEEIIGTVEQPAAESEKINSPKDGSRNSSEKIQKEVNRDAAANEDEEVNEAVREEAAMITKPAVILREEKKKPVPLTETNVTDSLPTAQELIRQTLNRAFEKDNAAIRAERATAKALSAEKLVEDELKIASLEQAEKKAKNKKDASVAEAEELYQKLKKTGTLRN
ncbi:MAG TPA: 50S ribosomal protein L10 [Candidatus Nanoarchaeia archaeon]|nr:50S ribosomal protein L10 [Candidatus Nanoarchaeia archaeon]